MIKSNIKKEFSCDKDKLWNIITNNENYSWRSDLSRIEIVDDKHFIEFAKNNYPTYFTITSKKKLKEYKDREFANIQEMESHAKANESFHVTANMVLSLARRSTEIFESSEVEEDRQLLNFVFQNLELKDKKLSVTLREPFKIIKDTSLLEKCPGMCPE